MRNVDAVITELLDGLHPAGQRHITRLSTGVYEVDHDDPDQVVLLVAHTVPRRRLGPPSPVVVGAVDGVDVLLTDVVVDARVRLHLEFATPGPPAEELMHVDVRLEDDRGTVYAFSTGAAGPGHRADRALTPAPPDDATRLDVLAAGQHVAALELRRP